jgi:hypothetical protein
MLSKNVSDGNTAHGLCALLMGMKAKTIEDILPQAPNVAAVYLSKVANQVKLIINSNKYFTVQRATAQSKQEFFAVMDELKMFPIFQAGWSDCMYLLLFLCSFH